MGIPSLLRRMQDAGFGSSSTDIAHRGGAAQSAVIDGPNLVFYIAGRVLEKTRTSDDSIWPAVSYAEFAAGVIGFLDTLVSYGFEITAIFFDGALPSAKKETRIDRLQQYVERLVAYHTLHQEAVRMARTSKISSSELWRSSALKRNKRALPGLPFLVAAVVEALLQSKNAGITYVVPGEADAFCVAAARQASMADVETNITIFSNDSDLLVFDCGRNTRIVMFTGLDEVKTADSKSVLSGIEFWPAALAEKAGHQDLVRLAYLMWKNVTITMFGGLQILRQEDDTAELQGFDEFKQTYQVDQEMAELKTLQVDAEARFSLISLDARVSELIHQVKGRGQRPLSNGIDMFLPFLLDDPSKGTGWYIGRRARQAAYGILLSACGCEATAVNEYKRSGHKISLQTLGSEELQLSTTDSWLAQLRKATSIKQGSLSAIQRWRFAVMQLTLHDMAHEAMLLPLPEEIVSVLHGHNAKQWDLFHLSAQYQAAYYSLRMLMQIWQYTQSGDIGRSDQWAKRSSDLEVQMQVVQNLPGISTFFEEEVEDMTTVLWMPLVEAHLRGLDAELHPRLKPKTSKKRKEKKRRRKGEDAAGVEEKSGAAASSNSFAALDGMD